MFWVSFKYLQFLIWVVLWNQVQIKYFLAQKGKKWCKVKAPSLYLQVFISVPDIRLSLSPGLYISYVTLITFCTSCPI